MKIVVAKHAIQRLKERFRLRFPAGSFVNDESIRNLIIGQVENSVEVVKWKSSPGYVNMLCSKYGMNLEVRFRSSVYFVCAREGNTLFVKTVVPNWLCE